eukprot:TRINITY_DN14087_c0_g1_i1.p1 TRINITY_DN14087_c0_g1~~TRINITY_DN14087_c0_g1_i1.p1  ORF type:complete len:188 (-),score=0.08 TRINITY_DN14087_c0_g1_i1:127-651(-)
MDHIIQFGYLVMFSVVFPLGSLLALITNIIAMRSAMVGLKSIYQRGAPYRAHGIGSYHTCIRVLILIGVVTNLTEVAIVCDGIIFETLARIFNYFLADVSRQMLVRVICGVLLEHLLVLILILIAVLIYRSVPTSTDILQIARSEYAKKQLIEKRISNHVDILRKSTILKAKPL